MNANIDLIVSALKVFEELGVKSGSKSRNHDEISSLQDLEECFSHYFKKCAAAERFVSSKEVFDQIVEAAKKIKESQVRTIDFYFLVYITMQEEINSHRKTS